jgi:hypothetical protein
MLKRRRPWGSLYRAVFVITIDGRELIYEAGALVPHLPRLIRLCSDLVTVIVQEPGAEAPFSAWKLQIKPYHLVVRPSGVTSAEVIARYDELDDAKLAARMWWQAHAR